MRPRVNGPDHLNAELRPLKPPVVGGLARTDRGAVIIPQAIRNLVRCVANAFDAYLTPTAGRHAIAV